MIPNDEDFARVIDAMYGSITSSRLVRVEITETGPHASRAHESIVVRDEEHLVLWVLAENKTDAGARFSAESHGEGMGGYVEPGRSGSALFDAGAMHPGSFLLPVMVVADGRPSTIDLPIECRPSGMLRVLLLDDATGEAVAARVYLRDDVGPAAPAGATMRRDVTATPSSTPRASSMCASRARRGCASCAASSTRPRSSRSPCAPTPRSMRPCGCGAGRTWRPTAGTAATCTSTCTTAASICSNPADAALVQRAEDVHFLNMMVANQGSGWVHDADNFSGADHELSSGEHILRWGEEYRNNFYGHMCMYGINELVPPIYSGFPNSDARARSAVERRRLPRTATQSAARSATRTRCSRASTSIACSRRSTASASRRRSCRSTPRSATSMRWT